jgi:hypothetical protein
MEGLYWDAGWQSHGPGGERGSPTFAEIDDGKAWRIISRCENRILD